MTTLDEVLGYSVLYEEHKGDLAAARRLAGEMLDQARRQPDPAYLADVLVARGTVHLLQGEPGAALACFQEAEQIVPGDPDRRLRATAYAYLCGYWAYNLLPDGGGASGAELEARWDGQAEAQAYQARWQGLYSQATQTATVLESWLVFQLLTGIQSTRAFVQPSRFGQPEAGATEMLQQMLQSLMNYRQTAEQSGAGPALLAYADMAAADLCWRAGDAASAGPLLQRAWQVYQQAGDAAGMGVCQMLWGDWLAAPVSSPRAWNLVLEGGASGGSDLPWTTEAREFSQEGADLPQALTAYDQARQLFTAAGAPRGLAQLQIREGYLAVLAGDHAAAAGHAAAAEAAFEACGDVLGQRLAQAHRVLARAGAGHLPEEREVAAEIGRWGAGEGSFSYALGLGRLFGRVGRHWLIREGDYERALACYRLSAALYTALGAATDRAASVVDQATVYHALGERAAALALYEEGLDLYEQRPTPRQRIITMQLAHDVYNLYLKTMDADGMERSARRLEAMARELPADLDLSDLGGGLAAAARLVRGGLQGMLSAGAGPDAFLNVQALATANMARATVQQARVLVPAYRAMQARDRGDGAAAEQLFARALDAARAASGAQRDFLEGIVLSQQREFGAATAAFDRYLSAGGADSGFVGQLSAFMERAGGAQGRQERQQQRIRTLEQAFTFMVRARAYPRARAYLDQLVQAAGQEWWSGSEQPWLELSDMGLMYEELGQPEEALGCYDRAIAELEGRRHQLSRDEYKTALAAGSGAQWLYFQAARAALVLEAPGAAARAFAYVEQGKARGLLDLMAGLAGAPAGGAAAESKAMRAWRQANAQLTLWRGLLAQARGAQEPAAERLAYLRQQVEGYEEALREVEGQLARANPDFYRALNVEAEVLTVEQVSAILGERDAASGQATALLQYAFLGEDLLAWAITANGVVATHQAEVDARALAHQIGEFRQACARPGGRFEELGQQLARTFLAPLEDVLRAHSRLVVVPYGAAHSLPFHALPWDGQPLVAGHALSYLPSASALQFVGGDFRPGQRLLAVGNPAGMAYRGPLDEAAVDVAPLPAAAVEAATVAGLFAEGMALTGEEATEEALRERLGDYPLLHLATHGMLSEEAPLLSSILLAHGQEINVYELMGLRLDADLVVLSACRTALGEITGGDDVIGLTRGLLAAGARAAVVSLWPVDDVSTSLLMAEFYRQLRAAQPEPRPPAIALQAAVEHLRTLAPGEIEARLAVLEPPGGQGSGGPEAGVARDARHRGAARTAAAGYAHPYYWAPFILIG